MTKIELFKEWIITNIHEDVVDYKLFTIDDKVGIIMCDLGSESLDEHCDQCRDEILVLGIRGPSEKIPGYLIASVGPTKWKRIENGWRDSSVFDLNRVKFV